MRRKEDLGNIFKWNGHVLFTVPKNEQPISAIVAMLSRISTRADQLHDDLHELGCELSHEISHWIKKVAKLISYIEIESPNKEDPEVQELLERNLAELETELADFFGDATEDAPMQMMGQIFKNLFATLRWEWGQEGKNMEQINGILECFREFEDLLAHALPTARADIAVRHAYIALTEFAKLLRALDDRLANLPLPHPHELRHNQDEDYGHEQAHPHLKDSDI